MLFLQKQKGFSLLEILIGVFLLMIVFIGIIGAYRVGLRVVSQSRLRVLATALANQRVEFARNLSYVDVGTIGGIPPGVIPETETIARNGVDFIVKTTVVYVDDPFDGEAPADALPNDYKRVKVRVSWDSGTSGDVALISDISPKGLETDIGGGNLFVTVFNAVGIPISEAEVHVVNNDVLPVIDANFETNTDGKVLIAGAPASVEGYEVTVSKTGMSADQTYGTEVVAVPNTPHVTVLEGELTQISFSIDTLGSFSIDTFSPFGGGSFADSFVDASRISASQDIFLSGGAVSLASTTEYVPVGSITSISVGPAELVTWDEFFWNDSEPVDTEIRYRILFFDGLSWGEIPDTDLSGNSVGFINSPVDISGLSTTTYPVLRLYAELTTSNSSSTPLLADWQASWIDGNAIAVPNVDVHVQGAKTIGTDASENPVYKYEADVTTDGGGHADISGWEWDSYTFSIIHPSLSLVDMDPAPQPVTLVPGETKSVSLFVAAENNVLFTVTNSETAEPVFSASVRLTRAISGYDKTQFTNAEGQTIFIPLSSDSYNYEISTAGYQTAAGSVSASGNTARAVTLIPSGL